MRIGIRSEFDRAVKQVEWSEVLDTLQAAIEDVLGSPPNTPPPTPSPPLPVLPTELGRDICPQPVVNVHEAHEQAGVHSQGQFYNSRLRFNSSYAAAPPHTLIHLHSLANDQAPVINFCEPVPNLVPLQLLNGQLIYTFVFRHPGPVAPPPLDADRPYVKKPLYAFMLFMREQRQKWASLSDQERQRFYEKAEEEKLLHASQNPGWSSSRPLRHKEEEAKVEDSSSHTGLSSSTNLLFLELFHSP
ncbi:hypothetical protein Q5P01_002159 [Channa striata]|uniref:HMG box domain-containing protein n=1 Tax=Channa striata TaxID=64152 RepID=A0AA88NLZ4_CHASR|nr:hypothetical protein Q5P01_002159 [Channa striata]